MNSTNNGVNLFTSCVAAAFPTAKDHSGCFYVGEQFTTPPSGTVAVAVSKTGLMLFLVGVVSMMV